MADRPNILIFMTDQERGDVVEPGHPCKTPNADRLAADGVRFSHCYTPYSHCCPSRATFMTGLYPSRHGVYNNVLTRTAINLGLNDGVTTFSERLRADGYQLTLCGKWHVSREETPADRGWDEKEVTASGGTWHTQLIEQWREGPRTVDTSGSERPRGHVQRPGWGDFVVYDTIPDGGPKGYEDINDYKVVQAAVETLHEYAEQDDPWCLFVGPIGPHDPFVVPEKYAAMYDPAEIDLPPSYSDTLEDKPRIYQRHRRQLWDQLSEDEVRESIARYYAYCTLEDDLLGEVLDTLDATGQAENTVVIFMSDHGEYCGDHGLYLKGVPSFRSAYHVPCIVRWPAGLENPGRVVDEFVTLADFAPTFLDLAGVDGGEEMTGRSFLPFLGGETPADWPQEFHTQFNGVELYYTQRAISTKEYKFVYNGFDFDELYDLRTDPHEMTNVADDPAYAEVKRDLVRRMWQFAADQGDMIFNPYGTVGLAPWGPAEGLAG